jgi:periplasmic protein TonB
MKTIGITLLSLTITVSALLFTGNTVIAQTQRELVYTTVERQPEFPGGSKALSAYLAENIHIPNSFARRNYNAGPIAAKFIIGKDGSVRDVRITTKPLDKGSQKSMQDFMTAIISAVEKMPRWRPGQVNGEPVAVFYTLPIEVNMQ